MAGVIFEIARKEILSYYRHKGIIMQNLLLLIAFSLLPIQQINSLLIRNGYRASALSSALDLFLMVAAFYPIIVASGLSVFAFPVEKDQKTIEYLLSLPLSNGQIFLGKAMAAIIAGIAAMLLVYTVIVGYTFVAEGSHIVHDAPIVTSSLIVLAFAVVPGIIVLSTLMLVAISSYISNARESYMINIVVMGVMIGVNTVKAVNLVEPLVFNLGLLVVLLALIAVSYVISTKSFDRERLITRI
jgi:ABC-2 type transport system permease protein